MALVQLFSFLYFANGDELVRETISVVIPRLSRIEIPEVFFSTPFIRIKQISPRTDEIWLQSPNVTLE